LAPEVVVATRLEQAHRIPASITPEAPGST
jgi:hypothetical protein